MKSIITYFIILLIFNFSFSQEIDSLYVKYQYFDGLFNKEYFAEMKINADNSIYRLACGEEEKKPDLNDSEIILKNSLIDIYYIANKKTDTLFTYNILDVDILQIKEVLPKLEWSLDFKETKLIGDFVCKKATTKFRGREYEVWYNPNIKTSFGPWKLNGVPGLIFEAYDLTKSFIWQIISFETPSNNKIEVPYKKFVSISIIDYLEKVKERLENLRSKIRGSLPRGTELSIPKNTRNGLELIYEWENNK